jgi:transcriptional regulator with XRE-family HTH domain
MRTPSNPDPRAASIAFGRRLRQLRREHGLSQYDLATETGIHPTAIARMERGAREPRLTTIQRLAQGLDVHPGALFDEPAARAPAAVAQPSADQTP